MTFTRLRSAVLLLALLANTAGLRAADGVVVIGHASIKRLDTLTLARIYTGRVIEVDGISVTAINANAGSDVRTRFLQMFLQQDEDKYTAYWTVRRYIGKGASPREMSKSSDVIRFVTSTPGAIGYIDASDMQPGLNVLLR
jgi:ABC-type phosphate transport system substrate-binding protein